MATEIKKEVDDATLQTILVRLRELLQVSDLQTTTEKKLRLQLEEQFNVDLTGHKAAIRTEVEAYLTAQEAVDDEAEEQEPAAGAFSKAARKKPAEGQRKRGGGFGSILSAEMKAFLGVESMARPQVVQEMWKYIREHELQDPKDKRKIIIDDKLATLFTKPLNMFSMNKQLSRHVKSDDSGGGTSKAAASASDDDDDDSSSSGDEDDEDDGNSSGRKRAASGSKASGSGRDKRPAKKPRRSAASAGADGEPKKLNNFTRPLPITPELAAFVGKDQISRPELVSFVTKYVKEHNLKDPSNGQFCLCNPTLKSLTKESKFRMFGMQKVFGHHFIKSG